MALRHPHTTRLARFNADKQTWIKNKKLAKELDDEEHLPNTRTNLAALTGRRNHRRNGYFHILLTDEGRKKKYDNNCDNEEKYKFDYSVRKRKKIYWNFLTGAGSPIDNNPHHLIPVSCMETGNGKNKPGFDDEDMEVLQKVPYDVNHGENIIFLPEDTDGAWRYNNVFPVHWASHPTAIKYAALQLTPFRDKLRRALDTDPCENPKFNAISLLKMLIRIQDKIWTQLLKYQSKTVWIDQRAYLSMKHGNQAEKQAAAEVREGSYSGSEIEDYPRNIVP